MWSLTVPVLFVLRVHQVPLRFGLIISMSSFSSSNFRFSRCLQSVWRLIRHSCNQGVLLSTSVLGLEASECRGSKWLLRRYSFFLNTIKMFISLISPPLMYICEESLTLQDNLFRLSDARNLLIGNIYFASMSKRYMFRPFCRLLSINSVCW